VNHFRYELQTVDVSALLGECAPEDPAWAAAAQQLGAALQEIGFAILVGTGVETSHYAACGKAVESMFEGNSAETKRKFAAARHGSVNQGYFGIEETSNLHPDQVEGWVLCRRAFRIANGAAKGADLAGFWPSPDDDEVFWRSHVTQHERLIAPIMRAMLHHAGTDNIHTDPSHCGLIP